MLDAFMTECLIGILTGGYLGTVAFTGTLDLLDGKHRGTQESS